MLQFPGRGLSLWEGSDGGQKTITEPAASDWPAVTATCPPGLGAAAEGGAGRGAVGADGKTPAWVSFFCIVGDDLGLRTETDARGAQRWKVS